MKARASIYDPDPLPDVPALEAVYGRLLGLVRVLILARDFAGVLKTSFKVHRAARALIKAKARAAAQRAKMKMLACPGWRAKVITDLGGPGKLALWQAAMERAIARARKMDTAWQPPAIKKPAPFMTPQSRAAAKAKQQARAHNRICARASDNAQILTDPFRVDQDGLFRLPPLPRAPGVGAGRNPDAARSYVYDARKRVNLTGAFAPAMVWPIEFYAAERGAISKPKPIPAFVLGETPGCRRRPARRSGPDIRPVPDAIFHMRRLFAPP